MVFLNIAQIRLETLLQIRHWASIDFYVQEQLEEREGTECIEEVK